MNIGKYIKASNDWLKENRLGYDRITLTRVKERLKSSGLLSVEADSKTAKGSKHKYLTGILYLAPHKTIGFNTCPYAKTCTKDCLFNAGRGRFTSVTEARIIKTLALLHDPETFKANLIKDINRLIVQAKAKKMKPVIRLNGTSDLIIERVFPDILSLFSSKVMFYDYTKNPNRFNPMPYDLTFSYDGVNIQACQDILHSGQGRVAVVFKDFLPTYFMGFRVIDGDDSDLRFLDPQGVVVGLIAKGPAKSDSANDKFVIDPNTDKRCLFGIAS